MRIEPHRRLTLPNPKTRKSSRVPHDRHPASLHPARSYAITKVPRIPLDRRGDGCDLRVQWHAARREREALAKRGERVQVAKVADPE